MSDCRENGLFSPQCNQCNYPMLAEPHHWQHWQHNKSPPEIKFRGAVEAANENAPVALDQLRLVMSCCIAWLGEPQPSLCVRLQVGWPRKKISPHQARVGSMVMGVWCSCHSLICVSSISEGKIEIGGRGKLKPSSLVWGPKRVGVRCWEGKKGAVKTPNSDEQLCFRRIFESGISIILDTRTNNQATTWNPIHPPKPNRAKHI